MHWHLVEPREWSMSLGLTLLTAAAGLGPGVMWIDKKLTP